jgi:hypothetical protein
LIFWGSFWFDSYCLFYRSFAFLNFNYLVYHTFSRCLNSRLKIRFLLTHKIFLRNSVTKVSRYFYHPNMLKLRSRNLRLVFFVIKLRIGRFSVKNIL